MERAWRPRRSWTYTSPLCIAIVLLVVCAQFPSLNIAVSNAEQSQPTPHIMRTQYARALLRVVGRAPTGSQPKSVVVAPDGNLVYVCNFGRRNHESVTIHDATTLARVGMIEFPGNAVEAAFSPDGQTLYVSNFHRDVIEVIDVASRTVRAEISVGQHPKTIAVSDDGATLYVANWAGRQVSIVNVASETEVRRLRTGDNPRGIVVHPDGRLFVASFNSHYIQEFDAGGHRQIRRFDTCRFPRDLVIGPNPNRLFVTCTQGSVGLYDLTTGLRTGLGSVGHNPRSMDVSADGRWAATANFGLGGERRGSVTVVDLQSQTHHTTLINRADRLVGLAIHPGSELRVYATSWDSSELIVLTP